MNGRKRDVLIEDSKWTDESTGLEKTSDRHFVVWADDGLLELIKSIDGVESVYTGQPMKTRYDVFTDPRYDIEFIKREVEAAILIG